jgi:CRP-like cAMP-binding protein
MGPPIHADARGYHDHVLVRRLSSLWELDEAEKIALLDELAPARSVRRGEDIVSEGSKTASLAVILSGLACQYHMLADGQRQIVAFLLPGDIGNLFSSVVDVHDHGVSASTHCEVAHIPQRSLDRLVISHPNLGCAIWRYCLSQCSVLQSWLSNMRRRSAAERLAHLFCEQFMRLECVGLAERGKPVGLHIVQSDLADATGMSSVHVNRTLQQLRNRSLIGRHPALLEILDWAGLRELADFDPAYLHLRRTGEFSEPESRTARIRGLESDEVIPASRAYPPVD